MRLVWYASRPISTSGTTSSALKLAPTARIEVGVPLKYRWWNVPGMPANRKSALDAITAAPACALHEPEPREDERDRRRREHLEEAFDPEVHDPPPPVLHHGEVRRAAMKKPAPYIRPTAVAANVNIHTSERRLVRAGAAPATGRAASAAARRPAP